jgi:glycosyltransferase involved in cell wall biosynthesis
MRVSIIIAVYKDVEALELVLKSLKNQTYKNFEVIVVEDGRDSNMREYVKSIDYLDIKHTTQDDIGVRKARSQNNGIMASKAKYLIFIDGDCILYTTFIEGHVKLAQDGYVLSGRRLNLDAKLTKKLRNKEISSSDIEKNLFTKYLYLAFDKNSRFEQGISLKADGFIYNTFLKNKDRNTSILGCNFSCFKKDMLAINGFDESYGESAVSDDMDLDWRFRAYGLKLKSCKNIANMFHLNHKAHYRGNPSNYIFLMKDREAKCKFVCEKGINTH